MDGPTGPAGVTGADGPSGPTGPQATPEYAYIYNTGAESVPINGSVSFDTNGEMTSSITHSPGTSAIALGQPGTYMVSFSVSGVEANQMAVFLNGTLVPGSTYGSGAGTQQNDGQVIVTSTTAGDALTIRNNVSSAAVTLQTLAGGTATNANASVLIEALR